MDTEKLEKFGLKKVVVDENSSVRSIDRLPDGRWVLRVVLGDSRKATSKLWAKKIKSVDVSKENGYALEGEFYRTERGKIYATEIILKPGEVAVAVIQDGSWKHPGQRMDVFVALEDGVYTVSGGWESKGDKIKTIYLVYEILNFLNSNK